MKKARRRITLLFCSAAFLISLSCSSVTSPNLGIILVASISQQAPGSLTFHVGVENAGKKTESLFFTWGHFFDIEVRDHPIKPDPVLLKRHFVERGKVVWKWTYGKALLPVEWILELAPGESRVEEIVWDLKGNDGMPLPPGSYWAKIYITNIPRYKHLSTVIPLTI